ncbi:hypothetical protein D4T97_004575 [Siminovitchia acidinfaciens]|uniref:Staygreen protein domain-containing protein n=1 Tax=Siminovitchia acidinfaciens TaxID=2321395 RepID=A0A429Y3Y8_9BACI|nr:staygreen family protein [Siminovitchia acidinfaciens]RST76069.1 hypothetical protein D4T97_004575 [Siminovitchia acidinfaciens]
MTLFDPGKLSIKIISPANTIYPIEGRKYTLTHSDITAELFLDIGYVFNHQAIHPKMRDEVLAEWKKDRKGNYYFIGKAYVDNGEFSKKVSGTRFNIFKKEMSTALKGIVYGDLPFYSNYPALLDAPMFIHYESSYPAFRQTLYYGTPRKYLQQIFHRSSNIKQ